MKNTFKKDILDPHSSVFIVSFSHYEYGQRLPANGQIIPMLSFFLPKVKFLLLLDQPHVISDTMDPIIELYSRGRLVKKFSLSKFFYFPIYFLCRVSSKNDTRISYKIRDFFSVLLVSFIQGKKYDFFIGLEAINTIAGLLLKKIGRVKTVIYYVSDYSPTRFGKTWFNALYLWLDRFCVSRADFTWDVSLAMQKSRIESGLSSKKEYPVIHVPNGLFRSQIASLPIEKRNKYELVYMGILESDMGIDLAIRALKEVAKKYPKIKLLIIGGASKDIKALKILVNQLKINKSVIFYGFVHSNEQMAKIVRSCYIGLAPYRAFPNSERWYGDAGKIRQYLASGLPVVTTHVPPLGRFAVKKGAGLMTKDTVESFSDGIIRLLLDDALYENLAAAAEKISRNNTWENVYTNAFKQMQSLR